MAYKKMKKKKKMMGKKMHAGLPTESFSMDYSKMDYAKGEYMSDLSNLENQMNEDTRKMNQNLNKVQY